MKRLIAIFMLALVPLGWAFTAQAEVKPSDAIVSGAGIAAAAVAIGNVEPNVDFWPVYSQSTVENDISHSISGGIWPGFLIDAFFWLYGFQPIERAALGISESQYPNKPHSVESASSAFLLSNFANGCAFLFGGAGPATDNCKQTVEPYLAAPPGVASSSKSVSDKLRSTGTARSTRFAYPGVLEAASVWTSTDTRFDAGKTITESTLIAKNVTIGTLIKIDTLTSKATAISTGDKAGASAKSSLQLIGASVAGTPVTIDDTGVHSQIDKSGEAINSALAAQGLSVRVVQGKQVVDDSGENVFADAGGLSVRLTRARAEEAFPPMVASARQAACLAAQNSPLATEIRRVQVSEANPLFGKVPFAPLPPRLEVDQSVPPPVPCPFVNRGIDIALVLGMAQASSRLSPLPPIDLTPITTSVVDTPDVTRTYFEEVPFVSTPAEEDGLLPAEDGSPSIVSNIRNLAAPAPESAVLSSSLTNAQAAKGIRVLYGLIAFLGVAFIGTRSILRRISSP